MRKLYVEYEQLDKEGTGPLYRKPSEPINAWNIYFIWRDTDGGNIGFGLKITEEDLVNIENGVDLLTVLKNCLDKWGQ